MAHCQLGTLRWRVDPNNVNWTYQLDTAVIETLGGQVVQILGATLSDLTVSGDFGHTWAGPGSGKESWEMANEFHLRVRSMMDKQLSLPNQGGSGKYVPAENTMVHTPWPFTYSDGEHNWSFQVLVKAIGDPDEGGASIVYSNGKYNHRYQLTLFIVQFNSDQVRHIATDAFLTRIAQGIGWKKTQFHGPPDTKDAEAIIMANGGSISQVLAHWLGGKTLTYATAPNTPPPAKTKAQKREAAPKGNVAHGGYQDR